MKAVREDLLLKIAVDRMRMPWAAAVIVIASGLLVALLATTLLDGPLTERLNWQYLRGPLLPVAIVIYVLAIYPLMRRLSDRVTPSIRKVSSEASGGVAPTSHRRRWEVLSGLAGAVCWFLLSRPWSWVDGPLAAYAAAMDFIMFAMLGLLVFEALSATRSASRILRRAPNIDIFDTSPLMPVARWSLGISMAFLGGISITIAFQTVENLRLWENLVIYAAIIIVALATFFISVWSTHEAIVRAKRSQLGMIRSHLDMGFKRLQNADLQGHDEAMNSEIAAWAAFENRVESVSEWPYDGRILRRLLASALFPSLVYFLRLLGISF